MFGSFGSLLAYWIGGVGRKKTSNNIYHKIEIDNTTLIDSIEIDAELINEISYETVLIDSIEL